MTNDSLNETSSSSATLGDTLKEVPPELQQRLRLLEIQLYLAMQDKANMECKVEMLNEENKHLKHAVETKVERTAHNYFKPYENKIRDIITYYDTTEHGYASGEIDETEVDLEVEDMLNEFSTPDEQTDFDDMDEDDDLPSDTTSSSSSVPHPHQQQQQANTDEFTLHHQYPLPHDRSIDIVIGDPIRDRSLDALVVTGTPVLISKGAASSHIEDAAGPDLTEDCEVHIDDVGLCEPSTVYMTSTPGKLVHLKGVIYAIAGDTLINAFKVERHLQELVANILSTATERDVAAIGFVSLWGESYGISERMISDAATQFMAQIQLYFEEHPDSCVKEIRFFNDQEHEASVLKEAMDTKFKSTAKPAEIGRGRISSRAQAQKLDALFAGGKKPPIGVMGPASKTTPSSGGAPPPGSGSGDNADSSSSSSTPRSSAEKDSSSSSPPPPPKELDPKDYYAVAVESLSYRPDPDTEEAIEFEEESTDQIKCATVRKLVERVTHHELFDNNFMYAFMLTYRSFTTPQDLLDMLIERYNLPPPNPSDKRDFAEFKKTKLDKVRLRVLQVMKHWMEKHKYDFDDTLISGIETFIEKHIEGTKSASSASFIRRALKKLKEEQTQGPTTFAEAPPKPLMPSMRVFRSDIQLMDFPSKEIARQITLIEFDIFRKIHPKEFLNQSWNKDNWETQAQNIYSMIQRFNDMSRWCATLILAEDTPKKRARVLAKFINIAECCRQINNFNAIFEITSSLNSAAIHRLKKTWDMVSFKDKELFQALHDLISRKGNFRALREAMQHIDPPSIPYIGRYLSDLTFIEDGNPDNLNGKVNFTKRKQLATLIQDLQLHQQTPYNFERVKQLQEELNQLEYKDEKELYKLSIEREERKKNKKRKKDSSNSKNSETDDKKKKKKKYVVEE
eukprot:gb/GECH01002856.1/.p1 GENE.gb/GECH01002856.1/~~gb/GECH01002856.1/.p1  ORF type:complete len:906 (+),score=270.45 gb/GECH01002856.1/:1-2718(+)